METRLEADYRLPSPFIGPIFIFNDYFFHLRRHIHRVVVVPEPAQKDENNTVRGGREASVHRLVFAAAFFLNP